MLKLAFIEGGLQLRCCMSPLTWELDNLSVYLTSFTLLL